MPDYLVDAHLDAPNRLAFERSRGRKGRLKELFLEPMARGQIKACFMAIWPEEEHRKDASACFRRSLELLEIAEEEIALEPSASLVRTERDYLLALSSPERSAILFSMEGLNGLEERMEALEELKARGVLMACLTWNEPNALAGGAWDEERGITPLGRECLRRMEELGMILDLAHLNDRSFFQALELFDGAAVDSHTACREFCPHRRNLTRHMMKALADRGGVVGIAAVSTFLREDRAELEDFLDHLCFAVEAIGVDHVGVGFDFSYMLEEVGLTTDSARVRGLSRPEEASALAEGLRRRGFLPGEISAVCHGNWERILARAFERSEGR